jgi:two-component system chemotaxis response regulator CheY
MRTLVVDDDLATRTLMTKMLQPFGDVATAANGSDALAAFAAAVSGGVAFDLVTLDVLMPGISGHDVLRGLREFEAEHGILVERRTRVLMTTALDDIRSVAEAFHGLCDDYVVKPVRRPVLVEALQKLGLVPDQ